MNAWIRQVCLPLMAFWALAGCGPQEPIRIGLMAGLSDKGSDFGESVRNGVILAVEHQNQAGGINGRPIELIVRDDGQDPDLAVRAARELIALKPDIVIGPVTSAMAKIVIPMMNEAGLTAISPTVASTDFKGLDDAFFRVNRTTAEAAEHHAGVLYARGARRVGLVYDIANRPYSETWLKAFKQRFETLGGTVSGSVSFDSIGAPTYADLIQKLLRQNPDALLFIASTLDTARLCQQARRQAPQLALSSTEWAASGELLAEMGGNAVDGLLIAHAYNRDDPNLPYQNFKHAFKARFQRDFGSFSLLAYDTATIVFTALKKRQTGESMKQALLRHGPYQGLQQEIRFDAFGDTTRQVFFTEIRNGQPVQVQ